MNQRFNLGLAAALILSCATLAMAEQDFGDIPEVLRKSNWELGFQTGMAIPIGNKSMSILANNSAFAISDPGSIGEDEFSENGLTPPDFTGQTNVQGDVQSSLFVGGHFYYRITSWIATGVEGSVNIERGISIRQGGAFQVPIYNTEFRSHGAQFAPAIRLGGWLGHIRPYAMAGAGPYYLYQKITAELLDVDDANHPPIVAGETSNTYLSAIWGGGVDFDFYGEGSVGLAVQYQRVFMPGNNLQYFIPTMRFDYHF